MTGWFEQTGIILFVEHYERCVAFYRDVLELPIEEQKPDLIRFGFGGAYLMVERGGVAHAEGKSRAQNPTTLRFNVADIDQEGMAIFNCPLGFIGFETRDILGRKFTAIEGRKCALGAICGRGFGIFINETVEQSPTRIVGMIGKSVETIFKKFSRNKPIGIVVSCNDARR